MKEDKMINSSEETSLEATALQEDAASPSEEIAQDAVSAPEEIAEEPKAEETKAEEPKAEETAAREKAPESGEEDEKDEKPMSKGKRIANAVILALQIAFVVLAITICLVVMLNPQSGDKVSPVGVKLLPVLTGSMEGTNKDSFPKGALVIATTPKNKGANLGVGKVVTFKMLEEESGQVILVTHRIIEVVELEPGLYKYKTQGDANPIPDEDLKWPNDILAVYAFHINGLGSALTWIRTGYNFIYVIIIPLGLLLIYNIYLVAQIVVESKMKKAKALAAASAKEAALASIDEEEIKRRAIEEYLKSQGIDPSAGGGASKDKKE